MNANRWLPWFLLAAALDVVLLLYVFSNFKEVGKLRASVTTLDHSLNNLIRVFPKTLYTRNELALALTAPALAPTVQDCAVKFHDLVFVFDRSNVILAIFPEGNPHDSLVSSGYLDPGYRCDDELLRVALKRRAKSETMQNPVLIKQRELLSTKLEKDVPSWGPVGPSAQAIAPAERPEERAVR